MKPFKLMILTLGLVLAGCASKLEKKNELVDHSGLEKEEAVGGETVLGVRDNKVKVQRKVFLAEELRRLENLSYGLQYEVYGNREYGTIGLYGAYKECKSELQLPKYGGKGKLQPVEPAALVINEDPEFQFAKTKEGDLVGFSEEYLSERLDRFKKYRDVLRRRRSEYEQKLEICEHDLKVAKSNFLKNKADAKAE